MEKERTIPGKLGCMTGAGIKTKCVLWGQDTEFSTGLSRPRKASFGDPLPREVLIRTQNNTKTKPLYIIIHDTMKVPQLAVQIHRKEEYNLPTYPALDRLVQR